MNNVLCRVIWGTVLLVGAITPGCNLEKENMHQTEGGGDTLPDFCAVHVVSLDLGPVTTFEQHCSRCHGSQGSFYGEEFARLDEKHLMEIVEEMMVGPSFLDPSEEEVAAMTAYHHALRDEEPFICVTGFERSGEDSTIRGEAGLGSDVTIKCSQMEYNIEPANDGSWQLSLHEALPCSITAVRDKKTTILRFPLEQWSHSENH